MSAGNELFTMIEALRGYFFYAGTDVRLQTGKLLGPGYGTSEPAGPLDGDLFYRTDTQTLEMYDATAVAWRTVSIPGGGVAGAGTADRLTQWTGAATIGNSNIIDNVTGDNLQITAALTAQRTLTLPDADVTITDGGTIALGGFTLTVPATGTAALGAGTLTVATANDATIASHTHAITSSSNPGAAAAILASTAAGGLTLQTFTSAVAIGTVPYSCTSTTLCPNLNADMVDSLHAQTLTATSPITLSAATKVLAAGAITIAHATTAGNIHLPTGGAAGQIITYAASGTGAWTTATYPATTTAYQLIVSTATNVIGGLAVGTTGQILTGVTGAVPAWSATPSIATSLTVPLIYGSAAADGDITIEGTSHATKTTSYVILQPTGGYVGIGTTVPDDLLQVGSLTSAQSNYVSVKAEGNDIGEYYVGIKLRSHTDDYGFTIRYDGLAATTTKGLDILRHPNSAAGDSALFIARDLARVGINTAAPGFPLTVEARADSVQVGIRCYSVTAAEVGTLMLIKSRSATAAYVETQPDDYLGQIYAYGVNTTPALALGGYIRFQQTAAAGTYVPTRMLVYTYDTTSHLGIVQDPAGKVGIGTAAPAALLELYQGAADTAIFKVVSSDVAHGMTDYTETDCYGYMQKAQATAGGLAVIGLSDADGVAGYSLFLGGYIGEGPDHTKTTASIGVIHASAAIANGAGGITSLGSTSDDNLFVIANYTSACFIFDAEGSAHADVAWTTFDDRDDVALLTKLEQEFSARKSVDTAWSDFVGKNKQALQDAGIVNFYDSGPRAMVNFTRLNMLMVGAIRQVSARMERYEQALLNAGIPIPQLEM